MRYVNKIIVFLLVVILSGCSLSELNTGPLDMQMGNDTGSATVEDGDPFEYFEYDDAQIPVLPDPLNVDELFYLQKSAPESLEPYWMIPKHFLATAKARLGMHGEIGDSERFASLVSYVDIEETGYGYYEQLEGYLLNDGSLYLLDKHKWFEEKDADERIAYIYTTRKNEAYIERWWSYTPPNPNESTVGKNETSFVYDLDTRELKGQESFRIQHMEYYSMEEEEIPEYKHDVKKDVSELRNDLRSTIEIGEIRDLAFDEYGTADKSVTALMWVVGNFIADGVQEEPIMIRVSPEIAYLQKYIFNDDGTDMVMSKDDDIFRFDEGWRLLSWENSRYEVDYSYGDSNVELSIRDKETGSYETVNYEH